ncbi:uncharacterized protein LOC106463355 isoform X2 [Limulus polyphemus]|uniref:Uncharacterized protein LOC106463355 isoform X2 n=1 Tax=Limulus polyphemus TaxID=6850 RepID=A0ABM1SSD2_LIMPO|nr:uncharacterized protein LOC106463355 isoform X2 [Limulus polyphemus]
MSLNPSDPVSQLKHEENEETPMNGKACTPQNSLAIGTASFQSLNKHSLKLNLRGTSCFQDVKNPLEAPSSSPRSETPTNLTVLSLHSHLTVSKPPKKRYVQNGTFKPTLKQLPADLQTTSACSALQELAGGCLSGQQNIGTRSPGTKTVNRGDSCYSCNPCNSIARFENKQKSQVYTPIPMMEIDIDKDLSQMSFNTSVNPLSQSLSRKHNLSSFSQQTQSIPIPTDSSSFDVLTDEPINLCKKQAKTFQTSQQKIINHVVDKVLCRPFGNAVSDCFPDTTAGKWQNQLEHIVIDEEDISQKMKIRRTRGVKDSSDIQDETKSPTFLLPFSTGEDDKRKTLCSRICEINKYCVDEPFNPSADSIYDELHIKKYEKDNLDSISITNKEHKNNTKCFVNELKCPEDSSNTFPISLETRNNKSLSTECHESLIFNEQKMLFNKDCDTKGGKSSCPKTIVHVNCNGIVDEDCSTQAENEKFLPKDIEKNSDGMDRDKNHNNSQCGVKKRKCIKVKREEIVDKPLPGGN